MVRHVLKILQHLLQVFTSVTYAQLLLLYVPELIRVSSLHDSINAYLRSCFQINFNPMRNLIFNVFFLLVSCRHFAVITITQVLIITISTTYIYAFFNIWILQFLIDTPGLMTFLVKTRPVTALLKLDFNTDFVL